jgi:integrase
MPLWDAVACCLATLDHPESAGTRKQYGSILGRMSRGIGDERDVASVTAADLAAWMKATYAGKAPHPWNDARACLCSAWNWFGEAGWAEQGVPHSIRQRKVPQNRDRAIPADILDALLADQRIPIRERALWRFLLETAARESEVLRLNVQDLDMAGRRAQVTRKGSARDWITWTASTSFLLPRMLQGRKTGPLFVTSRKACTEVSLADMDPGGHGRLSARQAQATFRKATEGFPGGPYTLHQIRHRKLSDMAAQGASQAMLKAKSGHRSDKSLAIYALVSPDGLSAWEAEHDPKRRH